MSDLVSVYLPTHNRVELLKRAIDSVLNQTYENIELIICDDGSSDCTWEVLKKIAEEDKRVVLTRNAKPRGACVSRNKCIDLAKGVYITGLDDDDYFLPERIECFVDCINREGVKLVCGNLIYKYKDKNLVGERYTGLIEKKDIGFRNIVGNQIFSLTSLFKSSNGFDESAPAWQDYDLWFRLINDYGPCYRIKNATYVMDVSHDLDRITTSSKAYEGYKYFLRKHMNNLTLTQKNNLFLEDKKNRGECVKFIDVFIHPCKYGMVSYFKSWVKRNFPFIASVIDKNKMDAMGGKI